MQRLSPASNGHSVKRCAREMLDAMPLVTWFIRRRMRQHRSGLSVPQFRTLMMARREKSASLSAVAEHLGCTLPTASRIVSGLVRKEFLERNGCATDRRQMSLCITEHGQTVMKKALRRTRHDLSREINGLSAEERATLLQAMGILKRAFGTQRS